MPETTGKFGEHGIQLSNLGKVYWPDDGITKGDMLDYYEKIAPVLLPYLKDRPVTVRVYPEGIRGFSYYRRDMPRNAPSWLRSAEYRPESTEELIRLPLVDDVAGLLWLANQGGIEFHLWTSRVPDLAEPDVAVFDLDPGDEASYEAVLNTALLLREVLKREGLRAYPKTSGGNGMHVFLPLASGHAFEQVRAWVKSVADELAAEHPDLVSAAGGPTHRGELVTVDYAQNSGGRNTAAPYTLRARPGAPVSTPVSWEEIEAGSVRPSDLTLRTIPRRLEQAGDLFSGVLQGDQRLPEMQG